jgi:iron complex outermembrane receptor protein
MSKVTLPLYAPIILATVTMTLISSLTHADMESELLALLEEQTTLATQTRLNADYVPGMLTVLYGEQLEFRGAKNVWEALNLIPGVQIALEETGRQLVVMRGLGRNYASGYIKMLLNGSEMNSAMMGYAPTLLGIPITQVERIEIIRGPGSAVHGEYAYSGVINIITRQQDQQLSLRVGEGRDRTIGIVSHHQSESRPFSINLNLSLQGEQGDTIQSGNDRLYAENLAAYSHAPGPSNEARENKQLLLGMQYADTRLQLQWLEIGYGDHFGINSGLPPDENRLVYQDRQQSIDLNHQLFRSDALQANVKLGWMKSQADANGVYAGYTYDEEFDWLFGPDWVNVEYTEQRRQIGADLQWSGWDNQRWLLAWQRSAIEIKHSHILGRENDVVWFDEEHPLYPIGSRRRINSLTLQDEIRLGDPLTLTLGLRHDEYSDVGNSTNPRIAAVWRLDPKHIIKAQYSEAFRPPSLTELAGAFADEELQPATIQNHELGYIHKGLEREIHVTLFDSKLENFTLDGYEGEQYGFRNASARQQGLEFEWKQALAPRLHMDANVSYLHSEDDSTGHPLPGSSRWLGNLAMAYHAGADWRLNVDYRYTGKVWRDVADERAPLDSQQVVNATLSYHGIRLADSVLRVGLKNIFNEAVYQPAPINSYPDDLPRAGRLWWLSWKTNF